MPLLDRRSGSHYKGDSMTAIVETTMVNHLGFAIPPRNMSAELDFWRALGFGRVTRTEPKMKGYWLKSGDLYIHLHPTEDVITNTESQWTHVAFVPAYGIDHAIQSLNRVGQDLEAEHAETWWGARRIFVHSPSGYRVELVEYSPPARWSGPPADD